MNKNGLCMGNRVEVFTTQPSQNGQYVNVQKSLSSPQIIINGKTHTINEEPQRPHPTTSKSNERINLRFGKVNIRISNATNLKIRENDDGTMTLSL
jgi:hypothetical protein